MIISLLIIDNDIENNRSSNKINNNSMYLTDGQNDKLEFFFWLKQETSQAYTPKKPFTESCKHYTEIYLKQRLE